MRRAEIFKQTQMFALTIAAIVGGVSWMAAQDRYGDGDRDRDRGGYSSDQFQDRDREVFQAGRQQGEVDARRGIRPSPNPARWQGRMSDRDRHVFNTGYDRGYDNVMAQSQEWDRRGAYQEGLREGQADAQRGRGFSPHGNRWRDVDQRAYIAGYNRGYHDTAASGIGINLGGLQLLFQGGGNRDRERPERDSRESRDSREGQYNSNQRGDNNSQQGQYNQRGEYNNNNPNQRNSGPASLSVQGNTVNWQSPAPNARIYMSVDNQPEKLFASSNAGSGSQAANWMQSGHTYTFIMRDQNGNELTRTQASR